MSDISAEGHTIVYNGGSEFAQWWISDIAEVADPLKREARASNVVLDEFYPLYRDPRYWTMSIAFMATTGQRPDKFRPATARRARRPVRLRQRGSCLTFHRVSTALAGATDVHRPLGRFVKPGERNAV